MKRKISAKQQAIKDIKDDLKNDRKTFIAFRNELNKPIRKLVNQHLREQRNVVSINLTLWTENMEEEDL